MAIQFMDDFTGYGTDASRLTRMLDGVYAEAAVDLVADPDPSAGGQFCCQVPTNTNTVLRRVLSGTPTTVGVAQRIWLTALPFDSSVSPQPFSFSDINNNVHIYCVVNPSGYLVFYRRDASGDTQIAITSTPVITAGAWRHFECKVVFDNTLPVPVGSIQVRLEGITVLNQTGIKTFSTFGSTQPNVQNVFWRNNRTLGAGPNMYIKDLIVWDSSGTANNNFMGSCQVYKIVPDGDVTLGWTPNSGVTGWNKINETTPDDDAGYISAAYPLPSPTYSQFTMTDLPINVTSVRGIQVIHRSRKTDGGDGQVQTTAITTGGSSNGADRTISTAYTYWWDVMDLAPGSVNWTRTLVNGLNIKINRTV